MALLQLGVSPAVFGEDGAVLQPKEQIYLFSKTVYTSQSTLFFNSFLILLLVQIYFVSCKKKKRDAFFGSESIIL